VEIKEEPEGKTLAISTRKTLELGDLGDTGTELSGPEGNQLALTKPRLDDEEMEETGTTNKESPLKIQDKKRMKTTEEEKETNPNDISMGHGARYIREQ
jgi:hypothetical protein